MDHILVPVSPGELIDKLTILQIKSERITDEAKLANVRRELEVLTEVADRTIPQTDEMQALRAELYEVNGDLWRIEDDIREHERRNAFDAGFIALARSVYVLNDSRADVKKRINLALGSDLIEEKSYSDYGAGR